MLCATPPKATAPIRLRLHCRRGAGQRRGHICTGTGLTPASSAPGLGSLPPRRGPAPWPHLHRDWARRSHICAAATSAPGLGSLAPATSSSGRCGPSPGADVATQASPIPMQATRVISDLAGFSCHVATGTAARLQRMPPRFIIARMQHMARTGGGGCNGPIYRDRRDERRRRRVLRTVTYADGVALLYRFMGHSRCTPHVACYDGALCTLHGACCISCFAWCTSRAAAFTCARHRCARCSWCGHCKKLDPIYKKLAKAFATIPSVSAAYRE